MKMANHIHQVWVPALFILLFILTLLLTEHVSGATVPDIPVTFVKGGCFVRGDWSGEGGNDEKPLQEVCVDDFSLGTFEVSEAEWQAVMGSSFPLRRSRGSHFPASGVSWHDSIEFIARLNALSGMKYRLPTEAEWEYAARSGGQQQKYAGTADAKTLAEFACGQESCGGAVLPVGSKRPNTLGLHDMSGNVWEWVQDRYDPYYYRNSPRSNPQGDPFGVNRILRGGSSNSVNGQLRTTYREYMAPDTRQDGIGFRVALPAR